MCRDLVLLLASPPTGPYNCSQMKATYASYKKYQDYYPVWKPEYEQYVKAQSKSLYNPALKKLFSITSETKKIYLQDFEIR